MYKKSFNSIEKKLLVKVLFASFILTTIFTAFMVYLDFNTEINLINKTFIHIKKSSVPSLTSSLWKFDSSQTDEQLKGILVIQDIVAVKLMNSSGEVISTFAEDSQLSHSSNFNHSFELIYQHDGLEENLGTLIVTATKANIFARIKTKILYILVSQSIKTFLVSLILLLIFRKNVTDHLKKITAYFADFNITQEERPKKLFLARNHDGPSLDEFDELITKINQLVAQVVNNNKEKSSQIAETESKVERQKVNAISSAKLAALGEMAGGIAHEINGPLAIISTSMNFIRKLSQKKKLDEASLDDVLKDVESTVERVSKIITGLRTVSRDSNGFSAEDVKLKDIFQDLLALCSERFKHNGVLLDIDLSFPEFEKTIYCDRVQISQALINLIGNAFDAVKLLEEKWVRVEVSQDDNFNIIKVIDSGKAIPWEIQSKIFNPFYTSKKIGEGTGLGLSISKTILEKHSGSLNLDKSCKNTCFVLHIAKNNSYHKRTRHETQIKHGEGAKL